MKRWRFRITIDLERHDEDEPLVELTPAVSSFGFEVPRTLSRDDEYEWEDAQRPSATSPKLRPRGAGGQVG